VSPRAGGSGKSPPFKISSAIARPVVLRSSSRDFKYWLIRATASTNQNFAVVMPGSATSSFATWISSRPDRFGF